MDLEKRVQYMRISLGLCGIGVSNSTAEIICRVSDSVAEMGGEFDLKTAVKIQVEVEQKYSAMNPAISVEELEKLYQSVLGDREKVTTDELLDSLKRIIETNREIPI